MSSFLSLSLSRGSPKENVRKVKARISDCDAAINLAMQHLFKGERPQLINGKVNCQRVLPHGAMLDDDNIERIKESIDRFEAALQGIADKKGAFKVEVTYKEGQEGESPFGSKSPDKVVFKIEPYK
eukprot:EG_transcript_40142